MNDKEIAKDIENREVERTERDKEQQRERKHTHTQRERKRERERERATENRSPWAHSAKG